MQGGHANLWDHLVAQGWEDRAPMRLAAHNLPPRAAGALVEWAEEALQLLPAQSKAGVCTDLDEDAAWAAVKRWLAAWKANPQQPSHGIGAIVQRAPLQPSRGPANAQATLQLVSRQRKTKPNRAIALADEAQQGLTTQECDHHPTPRARDDAAGSLKLARSADQSASSQTLEKLRPPPSTHARKLSW